MTIMQKEKFSEYVETSMANELMRFSGNSLSQSEAMTMAKVVVSKIN